MARKVEVQLLDDIDGNPADETVSFGLDGTAYEVDLSAKNAGELRAVLAKYVTVARKVRRGQAAPTGRARRMTVRSVTGDREQNKAIREWARTRGIELSERGRIPRTITEQYEAEVGRP